MNARSAACVAFALCAVASAARAGLFDDDEARKRITDLQVRVEARLSALEATVKSQGLIDLLAQVEALKGDIAQLRGQMEVLSNDLDMAQKRQRDLYVDLDTRLRKLESGPAAPAAPGTPEAAPLDSGSVPGSPAMPAVVVPGAAPPQASPPGPPPAGPKAGPVGANPIDGEQQSYDAALEQFKAGSYGGAIDALRLFIVTYPKSPLAPSAQYWIGNAQYAQREFNASIATQRQLVRDYPDSQKVPEAMLNISSSQLELGDTAAARKTLDEIVAKYPLSDAAEKAKKRLVGMR